MQAAPAVHHDHDALPLRHAVKERLITTKGMRIELKLILGLAVAQLLVAAVLLALKNLSGGAFNADIYAFEGNDGSQFISAAAFVAGIVIASAAWTLVLAGAYRAGWLVRVFALGAFGWAFWSERDAVTSIGSGTTIFAAVLLGAVVALGVATWFPEHSLHRRKQLGEDAQAGRWRVARIAILPLLFLLIGGTYLGVWMASNSVGPDQSTTFSNDVFDQIDNIEYLLIPLLVLAGADFGEWASFAVGRLIRGTQKRLSPWIFSAIIVAVCALIIYYGLQTAASDQGGGIPQELGLGALVLAIAGGVYLLAKPKDGWKPSVPFVTVAIVAVIDTVSGFVTQAVVGDTSDHLDDYIALVSAGIWVVGGLIAIALLASRRGKSPASVVAGATFVVLIGITDLLGTLWVFGNFDTNPFGIDASNAPYLGAEGLRSIVAIVTILVVVIALVRRRLTQWLVPIGTLLTVTVSMQVLTWIDMLYSNKAKLEGVQVNQLGNLAIGGGVILLAALLWDLAVSGEAVTNIDGKWFPRDTRLLMFMGYILLVSSAVLMFSSLHDENGHLLESAFDPEMWVQQGILFLGIPLVMTIGLASFHRWRSAQPR